MKPSRESTRKRGQRAEDMKTWTPEGHLTELALDARAGGEADAHELQAIDGHLEACSACRAHEGGWRRLIHALESLPALETSPSFDDHVMARVRATAEATPAAAWLLKLGHKLRPVAIGAAGVWSTAVVAGAFWLGGRVDIPATALVSRGVGFTTELVWAAVLKIGATLQVSGFFQLWARVVDLVPGPGVISAVAVMTAISGAAIWTLYRVVGYEPSRIDAHV